MVEILGGGEIYGIWISLDVHAGAYRTCADSRPRIHRQTTTRVISALASSEVLCWSLEGGMGDGGYSPSGRERDDKIFSLFPVMSMEL